MHTHTIMATFITSFCLNGTISMRNALWRGGIWLNAFELSYTGSYVTWCDKASVVVLYNIHTLEIFPVDRGTIGPSNHKVSLKGRPRRVDKERHQEDQGHHRHRQQHHKERVDVECEILQYQFAPFPPSAATKNPHLETLNTFWRSKIVLYSLDETSKHISFYVCVLTCLAAGGLSLLPSFRGNEIDKSRGGFFFFLLWDDSLDCCCFFHFVFNDDVSRFSVKGSSEVPAKGWKVTPRTCSLHYFIVSLSRVSWTYGFH